MGSEMCIRDSGLTVADVVGARPDDKLELTYVNPQTTVREAIETMRGCGVSRIPVAKGEMPISAAEVFGSVSEESLREKSFEAQGILDRSVEELMDPPLPIVGIGETVAVVAQQMENSPILLVLDAGKPRTLLTRAELLQFGSNDPQEVRSK